MKKKLIYGFLISLSALAYMSCSNSDDYVSNITIDETQKVIYNETFADTLGEFTAVSVSGDQQWIVDKSRQYAYMSGYVNPTNYANEDWLISPEIDLTSIPKAHFSFDHVARYFTDPMNEATIWISEDYKDNVTTANWVQLQVMPFSDPGTYTFGSSGEVSLTPYSGKKVRIAFKYTSTATKAGTWEVKNFSVVTGEAVNITYNLGAGTKENPFTVLGGKQNQNNSNAWVEGYIVGYAWYSNGSNHFYFSADTCTQATNILIADSGRVYLSYSMAVQLPSGVVRNGLNLKDNKSLFGKKVTLYGQLGSYFGMSGLKNTSYYVLEDGTTGGTKPFDPANAIYYETFASSLGQFTAQSVTGNQVWAYNSTYKCAIMNGYASGARYVNEDWLISPSVAIPAAKDATVNFEMAGKYFYGKIANNITLYISKDYVSGSPTTATWTQLTIPYYDTSDNFTFTNTGDISLSSYKGESVRIAIKYTSDGTSTGTGQIEIRNFIVQ